MKERTQEEMEEFKKDMESIGLQIVSESEIYSKYGIGVEVDIDTDVDYSDFVYPKIILKKLTKRNDFFYISIKKYCKEKKRLTLFIGTPIDDQLFHYYGSATEHITGGIATTFPDLCWYHSEGSTNETIEEVTTKRRDGVQVGDLTWFLPTRMIDNFVEIMHTLNQSFLCGLMQEAIVYGPYVYS